MCRWCCCSSNVSWREHAAFVHGEKYVIWWSNLNYTGSKVFFSIFLVFLPSLFPPFWQSTKCACERPGNQPKNEKIQKNKTKYRKVFPRSFCLWSHSIKESNNNWPNCVRGSDTDCTFTLFYVSLWKHFCTTRFQFICFH